MNVQSLSIGIVGLGYVGLPLALSMQQSGYDVIGVDIDEETVATLNRGESTISDVSDREVADALSEGIEFTAEYSSLADVDGVSVCVPTPLRKTDTPDMSFVVEATERLSEVIPEECTVILESTVYPGATEEVVASTLVENQKTIGEDIFIAFSPERIDPGNEEYGTRDIPKVLGGITQSCGDRAEALYEPVFEEIVRVDSTTEAELVKLLENTFRAVNIGLINELTQVAHALDVDIWNVVDAAKTKPFGYMPFYPGPGLGGHCIPIDPLHLSWKAGEHDVDTRFINLADTVNREMPDHVVERVVEQLNVDGIAPSNANVLILGASYKPNVSDTRESPSKDIMLLLEQWDADVSYHDPHVPTLTVGERTYESIPLEEETLENADCVILVTDHSVFDIDFLLEHTSQLFDTRNATEGRSSHENVVRL